MVRVTGLLKSDLGKGIAVGLGVGAIAAGLAPVLRPFAKESIKYGILMLEKGRQWAGEVYDSFGEIVAGVPTSLTDRKQD